MIAILTSAPPSRAVTEIGTTLADSRQKSFGKGRENSASIVSEGANPDADGLINLVEYYMALDPLVTDDSDVLEVRVNESGDEIVCTYRRSKDAVDVRGGVEWSADTVTWSSDGVVRNVIGDLADAWIIEASVPFTEAERAKFLRLRVEQ